MIKLAIEFGNFDIIISSSNTLTKYFKTCSNLFTVTYYTLHHFKRKIRSLSHMFSTYRVFHGNCQKLKDYYSALKAFYSLRLVGKFCWYPAILILGLPKFQICPHDFHYLWFFCPLNLKTYENKLRIDEISKLLFQYLSLQISLNWFKWLCHA